MKAIVTKDGLKQMLLEAEPLKLQHIIGRALVVLHNNQTDIEKSINQTRVHNGVGFTGADAHSGSITAKAYLRNKGLMKWQIEKWMKQDKKGYPRLCKYHAQLNVAAIKKLEKSVVNQGDGK